MKKSYLYLLLLLVAFSCKESDIDWDINLPPKGRTVLFYVALDNSLSGEMSQIHNAILEGWSSDIEGSLVMLADSRRGKPVLIQFTEYNGKVVADTLRTYSNDNSGSLELENSASPDLLRQVINDMQVLVPGESYGMMLFSHASGWLPEGAYNNPASWRPTSESGLRVAPRSIFEDNGSEMELADFAAAIPDRMFDFIASEMCFMSSVETAYALRNKTDYLLASAPEVVSPGFIPIYKTSLDLLFKPEADLKGFAQAFYDHVNGLQGQYRSAAISVVRTQLMESLAALTRDIAPSLDQTQIDQLQYYDGTFNRDQKGIPHVFFDFADYIFQSNPSHSLAEEMHDMLSDIVIFKRNTPNFLNITLAKHSGLSVYIPQEGKGLGYLNEAYKETEWYKATH